MPRFSFLLRLPVIVFLAHAYVALRLALASPPGYLPWLTVLAVLVVYLLIMAGFAARRSTGQPKGDILAWVGFLCLGLFSWLFVLTVLRDAVLLAAQLISIVYPVLMDAKDRADFRQISAWAVLIFSVVALVLGLINARRRARVVDVDIALPGLPPTLDGFTLVQVTDLHVGPTIKRHYVGAVVDAVNALKPDVIILTGDLVDGSVERLSQHTQPLARLTAPYGVYAVTGNHEYYSGVAQWITEFQRLGMKVLMNQHDILMHHDQALLLAGVTDFGAEHFVADQASDPVQALRGAPNNVAVKILLAHQPRSAPAAAAAGFDVQLSGHTHGGQIWPWGYFVPLQQPFVAGLHRLDAMQVYVSRGTGYWGPPMRIGARSEITRIRLRCA
ncbi:MAG: metallophosphoesterase [Burkholderiaceae bacterium]|nr:metallophosphoesterase [Burkholderiaceae bacterium]